MKRWNVAEMLEIGKELFAKIHKRKYHSHHNHEIHFMAREMDDWLPQGIQSMLAGNYTPRHSEVWQYNELLKCFLDQCWEKNLAAYAQGLLPQHREITHPDVLSTAVAA